MVGFPAYPTGPSLLPYMVSRIVDSFQKAAATLFHIMELISIGLAAMGLIRIGTKLSRTKILAGFYGIINLKPTLTVLFIGALR